MNILRNILASEGPDCPGGIWVESQVGNRIYVAVDPETMRGCYYVELTPSLKLKQMAGFFPNGLDAATPMAIFNRHDWVASEILDRVRQSRIERGGDCLSLVCRSDIPVVDRYLYRVMKKSRLCLDLREVMKLSQRPYKPVPQSEVDAMYSELQSKVRQDRIYLYGDDLGKTLWYRSVELIRPYLSDCCVGGHWNKAVINYIKSKMGIR